MAKLHLGKLCIPPKSEINFGLGPRSESANIIRNETALLLASRRPNRIPEEQLELYEPQRI